MEKMQSFGGNEDKERIYPAFGIDLGTTNSAISVLRNGAIPEIIKLNEGRVTMPSCVSWVGGDKFIVGNEAYQRRYEPNTIYSVKRLMGTGESVILDYEGKKKTMTPAEVSAEILKELCRQASKDYGEIKDVVITVPAYFNDNEIKDTLLAGKLAKLNVLSILREPTGAALLYNNDLNESGKIYDKSVHLVYDLGGGTFDISLVQLENRVARPDIDEIYGFVDETGKENSGQTTLTVLDNEGDMRLGGDDIDRELESIIFKRMKEDGIKIEKLTREYREKLVLKLEQFKKRVSQGVMKTQITTHLNYGDGNTEVYEITVSKKDLIDATAKIYEKTKHLVDTVLRKIKVEDVSSIVLVGGSTKSIILKDFLRQDYSNLEINDSLNPDEAVALGAGLQANRLKFGNSKVQVYDILPLAIGILADDIVTKVIPKSQSVPYSVTRTFVTNDENQTEVEISIYQGNSSLKEECTYLGDLLITGIKPAGVGKRVPVHVTLSVNMDGVLSCSVLVDEKEKKLELTNLFAKQTKDIEEQSRVQENPKASSDKRVLRWKRFARTLEGKDKEKLINMLDDFDEDKTKEKAIVDFIRKHKKTVNFD